MSTDGSFLLSVFGQLEWMDFLAAAGTYWHCKYELIAGTDWQVVTGLESGVSQIVNICTHGDKIIFNFPIEITYKSTNPYGWPQIVISVYSGTTLQGYGRIHIPIQPGLHNLTVSMSKPEPSTFIGYLGTLFGYQPELVNASVLTSAAGTNFIKMRSNGSAFISLNILTKGLRDLSYDVGCIKNR